MLSCCEVRRSLGPAKKTTGRGGQCPRRGPWSLVRHDRGDVHVAVGALDESRRRFPARSDTSGGPVQLKRSNRKSWMLSPIEPGRKQPTIARRTAPRLARGSCGPRSRRGCDRAGHGRAPEDAACCVVSVALSRWTGMRADVTEAEGPEGDAPHLGAGRGASL